MKITICNNAPTNDLTVWADGKRISRPGAGMFGFYWDESAIENLLSEKQYREFEAGAYEFNVPDWKINLLTGKSFVGYGMNQRDRLLFISKFQ